MMDYFKFIIEDIEINIYSLFFLAQLAGAVEYTNGFSTEG